MATALERLTTHITALFEGVTITNELLLDYARAVASRRGMFDKLESLADPEQKALLVMYFLQLDAIGYVQERERAALAPQVEAAVNAKYPTPVPPASIT